MKQGLKLLLKIKIKTDREIESIDFVFAQGQIKKEYHYPSDVAFANDGIIYLVWEEADTWLFDDGALFMDTKIKYIDSEYNPIVPIKPLRMDRTLFERVAEND